jgi:cyanuric acid amidohydrolase
VTALKLYFSEYRKETASSISYVMSGGTEGILSPHFTVISRKGAFSQTAERQTRKALAIGVAKTADFLPEELGRLAQVDSVAAAVKRAIEEAGIESAADVHFVQIKCPLLTSEGVFDAESRAQSTVTEDTYKSMGYSRGASALGAAVALGEVERNALRDEDICSSWHLYSQVASTSAGSELAYCEVIVFGNSAYAEGLYFIDHDVMQDAIDAPSLKRLLDAHPDAEMVQVLAKAEADPTGFIRGNRHTMLDDSDINHTRHARAVVGGVLASVCGDPMIYVSGGAEHQGPPGGGPVAVVFKRKE